jgi:enamine deaminase RidA (YjgF/YER057c/UK114 family)
MIHTDKLPKPSYHWSLACEVKDPSRFLFLAGQGGVDAATHKIIGIGDCGAQVRKAFENIRILLAEAGMDFSNVVKFNSYLVSVDDMPAFTTAREEIYKDLYPNGEYPPHTLVIVDRLRPRELLFEIDTIAAA